MICNNINKDWIIAASPKEIGFYFLSIFFAFQWTEIRIYLFDETIRIPFNGYFYKTQRREKNAQEISYTDHIFFGQHQSKYRMILTHASASIAFNVSHGASNEWERKKNASLWIYLHFFHSIIFSATFFSLFYFINLFMRISSYFFFVTILLFFRWKPYFLRVFFSFWYIFLINFSYARILCFIFFSLYMSFLSHILFFLRYFFGFVFFFVIIFELL